MKGPSVSFGRGASHAREEADKRVSTLSAQASQHKQTTSCIAVVMACTRLTIKGSVCGIVDRPTTYSALKKQAKKRARKWGNNYERTGTAYRRPTTATLCSDPLCIACMFSHFFGCRTVYSTVVCSLPSCLPLHLLIALSSLAEGFLTETRQQRRRKNKTLNCLASSFLASLLSSHRKTQRTFKHYHPHSLHSLSSTQRRFIATCTLPLYISDYLHQHIPTKPTMFAKLAVVAVAALLAVTGTEALVVDDSSPATVS